MSADHVLSLLSIPTDVLIDIVDLLPTTDLVALSAVNRSFHDFIAGDEGEIIWRRKIAREFAFPVANSGRKKGWNKLYRKLHRGSCWVWGSADNGRLGIVDPATRARTIQGGLPSPTQLPLKQSIVGLESGGWSFHALTSTGQIVMWGQLDGDQFAPPSAPLSNPAVVIREPSILPTWREMGEVVQVQAGRKHVLLRTRAGEVWEYYAFSRAYKVVDRHAWGVPGKEVVAVEAGWGHSLVLTAAGEVFIWWEFGRARLDRLAQEAGEPSVEDPRRRDLNQGVTFTVEADTIRLPPLPPTNQSTTSSARPQEDKIVTIASTDHFVYALTQQAKLFRIDVSHVLPAGQQIAPQQGAEDPEDSPTRSQQSRERLGAAFLSGERSWEYMPRFSEVDEIQKLPGFAPDSTPTLAPPPPSTRISHISAHFKSFVAYSVPSSSQDSAASVVLLGTEETSPTAAPNLIPELQGKDVIKYVLTLFWPLGADALIQVPPRRVVFGDYHTLALTSHGQLFSWGAYSNGALGLGHPALHNTPLSLPNPSPTASSSALPPPTNHPLQVRHTSFLGFTRVAPAVPLPRAPERVDKPTLVRFPGDAVAIEGEDAEQRTKGKFVFHVCAAGWHSGALAAELGEEDEVELPQVVAPLPPVVPNDTSPDESEHSGMPGAFPQGPQPPPDANAPTPFAGRHFRLGYPARGMNRGFGSRNPDNPAGGSL